jgi:ABC-2 type transport system permease protein
MLVLLGLAFGSIALAISAATGNRGAAIGVAVGLMVVSYLIDGLANIIEGLNSIRWISPFKYYMAADPLRNGIDLGDAAVLAAITAFFLVAAVIAFDRRDLAS